MTLRNKIIEFLADSTDLYSISDIAKKLGCAYSHAYKFVQELALQDVVIIKKVGNVSVCELNMTGLTLAYLSMISHKKALTWKKKNAKAEKIIEKIEKVKEKLHFIIVKGSKVIIVTECEGDFTDFRNRTVLNVEGFRKNIDYYKDAIVLYGAEAYWSLRKNNNLEKYR